MEVKLFQILLAMGTLFTFLDAQPVPPTSIELLNVDRVGDRPFRVWANREVTDSSPISINQMSLSMCLRQCVNRGSDVCRSVDFTTGVTAPAPNCQLEVYCGNDRSRLIPSQATPPMVTTHYQFMELCGAAFNLVRLDATAINSAALPAGFNIVTSTQTSADACIVACLNQQNCQAADYSGTTCRLFVGSNRQRLCLPTVAAATTTVYQYPCLGTTAATAFANINEGVYPLLTVGNELTLSTAQQALNFNECLDLCQMNPLCGGIRFNTGDVFNTGTLVNQGIASCAHYQSTNQQDTPNILSSVCLYLTTPLNNIFTVLKEDCKRENSGLTGAMVQVSFTTLGDCLTQCRNEPSCVAVDWNKVATTPVNQRCWFHTEANNGCATPFDRQCCDHYTKIPTPCRTFNEYTLLDGTNLNPGVGTVHAATSTLMACRDVCNSMGRDCQGFDLNEVSACILYTENNICSALRTCTNCMHYIKRTFSCMWEFDGFHKVGGIVQTTLPAFDMSLPVCLRQCRLDSTCLGFDYEESGTTRCWIHRAGSICSALLRRNNIMHYRLRTLVCDTAAANDSLLANSSWSNTMQNFHSVGNPLLQSNVRSAIGCLELCLQRELVNPGTCSGVDYDKRDGGCYVASRTNACGAGVYDTCCDRLQLPTGCLAPQVQGYTPFPNSHRVRGSQVTGPRTEFECADRCNSDSLCAAFDWNTNLRECFLQTTTQECRNVNTVFSNNCCERYIKNSFSCPDPFVAPSIAGYTLQEFRHVRGGQERRDLNTEELCTAGCTAQGTCVSVDFNFELTICYVHTRQTDPCPEVTNPHQFVHRYVRTVCP